MNIVVLDGYTISQDDLNWSDMLRFGPLTYHPRTSRKDIVKRIGDAEAVLTSKCLIDEYVMDECPNLRYIGVLATGYNNVSVNYAKYRNIAVTNIPYYSGSSVAQFTFALILEIANNVGLHNASVKRGDWTAREDFCYVLTEQSRLAGMTLGIIGFGNIGRQVAQIAEAFGMKTLVHTPHPPVGKTSLVELELVRLVEFTSLDSVLRRSDILSLHCPATPKTEGMVNREFIAKMKDGAILINTARGSLINEEDLATALRLGKIKAAGIDVLSTEPPPSNNPLLSIGNCIITPHIGWITKEARERLIEIAVSNLKAYLEGENLNRIV